MIEMAGQVIVWNTCMRNSPHIFGAIALASMPTYRQADN